MEGDREEVSTVSDDTAEEKLCSARSSVETSCEQSKSCSDELGKLSKVCQQVSEVNFGTRVHVLKRV